MFVNELFKKGFEKEQSRKEQRVFACEKRKN